MEGGENKLSSGVLPSLVIHGLAALRSQHKYCDVILQVEEVEFHAHRVVLAAVSPFFQAMFESSTLTEPSKAEFKINEADPNTFSVVLQYIYSGTLEVDGVDLISVLELADFLQISSLKCLCAEHLISSLTETNVQRVWNLARTIGMLDLCGAAASYLSSHDRAADLAPDSDQIDSPSLDQVVVVAGGCDWQGHTLRTAECLTKLQGVLRWRHSRPPRRGEYEEPSDTLDVMSEPRAEAAYAATQTQLFVIGGRLQVGKFLSSVESFKLADNKWRQLAPLPVAVCGAAATVAHGRIFVIGGRTKHDWDKRVWIYNIETNHWHLGPNLPEKRVEHSVISWHDSIYVIGGKTESEMCASNSVLMLESGSSEWIPVAHLQQPRAQFACVKANGCVYAIGGTDGIHTISHAEKYNLVGNRWRSVANYSLPVKGCRAAALPGSHRESVLCIGGSEGEEEATNRVERLGVTGEQWHCLPELNTTRAHCAVAVLSL